MFILTYNYWSGGYRRQMYCVKYYSLYTTLLPLVLIAELFQRRRRRGQQFPSCYYSLLLGMNLPKPRWGRSQIRGSWIDMMIVGTIPWCRCREVVMDIYEERFEGGNSKLEAPDWQLVLPMHTPLKVVTVTCHDDVALAVAAPWLALVSCLGHSMMLETKTDNKDK